MGRQPVAVDILALLVRVRARARARARGRGRGRGRVRVSVRIRIRVRVRDRLTSPSLSSPPPDAALRQTSASHTAPNGLTAPPPSNVPTEAPG